MTIYLLNSLVIPINFDKYDRAIVGLKRVSIDEVKFLLTHHPFVSAIGHQGTAQLLSQLLGIEIPVNRITVQLEDGDMVIAFFLKQRLPEGAVLSKEELQKLDYWFIKGLVLKVE